MPVIPVEYSRRFTVSDFARDTIAKIENEPLFNVQSLNPELYEKINELGKAKVPVGVCIDIYSLTIFAQELRDQLLSIKKYILTCSRAERYVQSSCKVYLHCTTTLYLPFSLHPLFEQLGHLITDSHRYSLHDFVQVQTDPLHFSGVYMTNICH